MPPAQARLLALQRTAGNAVVARMVTDTAPGRGLAQQRFTTFENRLRPLLASRVAARGDVDPLVSALIADTAPAVRATLLDRARKLIDQSEGYSDAAVNAALAAVDRHDPERSARAVPGAKYLSPSVVTDEVGAGHINRDTQDTVIVEGEYYVPVYVAVMDEALGSTPKFKDVRQDEHGIVQIHTGGTRSDDSVMWFSFGQALRQLKWMAKYQKQKESAQPLIRSFLAPQVVVNKISGGMITERDAGGSTADINVDKRFAPNQIGVRNPRSLEQLRQSALPGSLRTYTDLIGPAPRAWGDARPADELRAREGVPIERMVDYPIFADGGGFTDYRHLTKIATELEAILDAHASTPRNQKNDTVETFFTRHAPARFIAMGEEPGAHGIAVHEFVQQVVMPWRDRVIGDLSITDSYQQLVQSELPEQPQTVEVAGERQVLRGERRSEAAALHEDQWRHMWARAHMIRALKGFQVSSAEFAEAGKAPEGPRVLGEVQKFQKTVLGDYRHRIGDRNTLIKENPRYARIAGDLRTRLLAVLPNQPGGSPLRAVLTGLARVSLAVGGTALAKVRDRMRATRRWK
ncbi:hypothetical protein BLA60_15580 [Actinophytocola xinjiangensis]|uniref:Uncharacterized protein n=2 Tax=Actinophytocola xinjiangensis TaxID=485602 RepID=A0A7Z1AXN7_9PSEU|nr:hypothetical protein BLA60_15580 [Actinophytocola xinjiangensis]